MIFSINIWEWRRFQVPLIFKPQNRRNIQSITIHDYIQPSKGRNQIAKPLLLKSLTDEKVSKRHRGAAYPSSAIVTICNNMQGQYLVAAFLLLMMLFLCYIGLTPSPLSISKLMPIAIIQQNIFGNNGTQLFGKLISLVNPLFLSFSCKFCNVSIWVIFVGLHEPLL